MALSWNISKTAWHKQDKKAREQEWPVVQAIITFLLVIGVSNITDNNFKDVLARIRFYEALNGGFLAQNGHDLPVPESILRMLVGMTTNVSTQSWAAFSRRISTNWYNEQTK